MAGEFTNRALTTIGGAVSLWGFIDANAVQVWGGAIVVVGTAVWNFLREQRVKDHNAKRNDLWMEFITNFRIKHIEQTGVDPFADGPPPLDFTERIELKRSVTATTTTIVAPGSTSPPPQPTKPAAWPTIADIFRKAKPDAASKPAT